MQFPVLNSLLPVILFIALGFGVGRIGWIRASGVKDLANLVFMVLTPALLFRTMSSVQVQDLDFGPVGIYFVAAALLFAGSMVAMGFSSLATARALAHTFSNTIMIGVPLVGLLFGEAGLVTLFTLISVHALILLTAATVVFELASAREQARAQASANGGAPRPLWLTVGQALRNGILHPVPLPIVVGLVFAQTGLTLPEQIDKPLQLLGQTVGPLSLLLVGVTLAYTRVGHHARAALRIALVKCVLHPLLLAVLGLGLGLSGLPLAVMIVAAGLPVGANVYMFAQRYNVAEDEVTASVAVSTSLALVTMPLLVWAVTRYVV